MHQEHRRRDWLIALTKGALGAIPLVGPLAAEVLGTTIPNQRLDRVEGLLLALERKVAPLDPVLVEARFRDPEFIDLLEDGIAAATRSLTDERREHIAAIVRNGITKSDLGHIGAKHLLSLLSRLNDLQLLLLRANSLSSFADWEEFGRAHPSTVRPSAGFSSPVTEHDRGALYDSYMEDLVSWGLLKRRYTRPETGRPPEFDHELGTLKAHGYEISSLGRLLLRATDQCAE